MVELSLKIGNKEANTLETTMLMYSFSSVLQWCFFVLIVILLIIKSIKKENAPIHKTKHSHHTKWKRR